MWGRAPRKWRHAAGASFQPPAQSHCKRANETDAKLARCTTSEHAPTTFARAPGRFDYTTAGSISPRPSEELGNRPHWRSDFTIAASGPTTYTKAIRLFLSACVELSCEQPSEKRPALFPPASSVNRCSLSCSQPYETHRGLGITDCLCNDRHGNLHGLAQLRLALKSICSQGADSGQQRGHLHRLRILPEPTADVGCSAANLELPRREQEASVAGPLRTL